MPEMGTSGLMSGDGKRGAALAGAPAPILDSTCCGLQPATKQTRSRSRDISLASCTSGVTQRGPRNWSGIEEAG